MLSPRNTTRAGPPVCSGASPRAVVGAGELRGALLSPVAVAVGDPGGSPPSQPATTTHAASSVRTLAAAIADFIFAPGTASPFGTTIAGPRPPRAGRAGRGH